MTINTAVGFVLKGDGNEPSLWLGIEYVKGFSEEIAAGIAGAMKNKAEDFSRAEAAAYIFLCLCDALDSQDARFGLSTEPPGNLEHTVHIIDVGPNGGVSLVNPDTQETKVKFTWREFVERFGYSA